MKKLLLLSSVIALSMSFVACGDSEEEGEGQDLAAKQAEIMKNGEPAQGRIMSASETTTNGKASWQAQVTLNINGNMIDEEIEITEADHKRISEDDGIGAIYQMYHSTDGVAIDLERQIYSREDAHEIVTAGEW